MKDASTCAICIVLFLLTSCGKNTTSTTVAARVGDATLTIEEAQSHVDTSRGSSEGQLQRYVSHWINEETIYQEARRKGFDKSETMQRQLDAVRRQLVIQAFLQEHIYEDTARIDEPMLHAYFSRHAAEFFVRDDMMKLNVITFNNRERAGAFAALIARGSSWTDAVQNILYDSSAPSGFVNQITGHYYTQHTLFPSELWKVASNLALNDASFPVKTALGYVVVQPTASYRQGKPAEFDLVRNEIRERMLIERRREQYEQLLDSLRDKFPIEMMLSSSHTHDSLPMVPHE